MTTPLPGENVELHLQRYGHTIGDQSCCARENFRAGYLEAIEDVEWWAWNNGITHKLSFQAILSHLTTLKQQVGEITK
jgi:hypothetical protein